MNNYQLTNIYNSKRRIYLFCRDNQYNLKIIEDDRFYPYFYNPDPNGTYKSFDGKINLKKIVCQEPSEVKQQSDYNSWESDIHICKRYIIDKIDTFEKCPIKYAFLDIECFKPKDSKPDPLTAKFPVTSIALYNSKYNKLRNWFINDFGTDIKQAEISLFVEFITYMRKAKFDLILAWYMNNFDYPYLFRRFEKLPQKYFFEKDSKYNNFATAISPIGKVRGGNKIFDNFYPAGTSIVDYLSWFKKIYKNEKDNGLDAVMKKYLGQGKVYSDVDFSVIDETIKLRNIADVQGLVDLEKKFKLIPLYDAIRRMSQINFEDFEYPMRIIDSLILKEAHRRNVILPTSSGETQEGEFEGAYRETFKTGDYYNIGKYDLSSAYPSIIKDLCLDITNISTLEDKEALAINISDRETGEIKETIYMKQNADTILPTIMDRLLATKGEFKNLKKNTNPENPEYENIELQYEAVKAITNTGFGTFGNKYFRLYNNKIVSLITSVARDLLHYLKDKLEEENILVLYVDTDGILCNDNEVDLSDKLNNLIQQWSQERFNKPSSIKIEKEGSFDKIFILTMCRYIGYLKTKKGIKKEVKGLQMKRKDSTNYISELQEIILNKIFDKSTQEQIIDFIKSEMERIKELPILDISFPAKLSQNIEEYKTSVTNAKGLTYNKKPPVHVQALLNTKKILPNFNKGIGENYYWIYAYNENKETIPMAFDKDNLGHIKDIAWEKMIERNITNIIAAIFEAKQWDISALIPQKVKKERKKKGDNLENKTDILSTLPKDIKKEINNEQDILDNLSKGGLLKENKEIKSYYTE